MKKKIFALIAAIILLFSTTSCSQSSKPESNNNSSQLTVNSQNSDSFLTSSFKGITFEVSSDWIESLSDDGVNLYYYPSYSSFSMIMLSSQSITNQDGKYTFANETVQEGFLDGLASGIDDYAPLSTTKYDFDGYEGICHNFTGIISGQSLEGSIYATFLSDMSFSVLVCYAPELNSGDKQQLLAKFDHMMNSIDLSSTNPSDSTSSSEREPSIQPYSGTFTAGHYTAGIDFPAGNYNLTAVSGTGNVSSDNLFSGGLNEIMGLSDNDIYQASFHGAVLETGVVLSISGDLQLQLDCSAAMTGTMQARQNTATQEYTFSSGNYVCGTDFEPGTYVLTAVSGDGNVSSDNMFDGGLNEIMGVQDNDMYIGTFRNAMFESGDTLSISGVTIQLTPSK